MAHDKFDELIQGFIDNDLTKDEEKTVKEHLKSCKDCREKLRNREKAIELIRKSKVDIKPPRDLIHSIIVGTTGGKIYRINWKTVTIGAAAIIILSLILFIYFTNFKIPIAMDIEKEEAQVVEHFKAIEEKIEKVDKEKVEIVQKEPESEIEGVITVLEKEFISDTRLVFPEEGSVVGNKFEIVIILREIGMKVELNIDGEKRIFKSMDSNILCINSDSLPILENGIHYLSLLEPTQEKVIFFKDG